MLPCTMPRPSRPLSLLRAMWLLLAIGLAGPLSACAESSAADSGYAPDELPPGELVWGAAPRAKADEIALAWQDVADFALPEGFAPQATHRLITTPAAFARFFGPRVALPTDVDFTRDWLFFLAPHPGADIASVRMTTKASGEPGGLLIATRSDLYDTPCPQSQTRPRLVRFAKSAVRPQSVRYFHETVARVCEPACFAPLRAQLSPVTDGLLYTSESDHPFALLALPQFASALDVQPQDLVDIIYARAEGYIKPVHAASPMEEISSERFFQWIAREEDEEMDDWERDQTARYRELRQLVQEHLGDLRIIRLGDVEVHIFLLGTSPCGGVVGLQTLSIET